MGKKYDIKPPVPVVPYDEIDETLNKTKDKKNIHDIESFVDKAHLDELDRIKELDEQNPLEQAVKYRAIKQNPPEQGYMEVRLFKDKDKKGNPVVVSESDIPDDDGNPSGEVKQYRHDPFFTVDLSKQLNGDITSCPSSVGPMLIDMAQKLVETKKGAFKQDKRRSEFNWWWIVLAVLLIPGILTVVFMMFGGGG